jgi:hypothetical protein
MLVFLGRLSPYSEMSDESDPCVFNNPFTSPSQSPFNRHQSLLNGPEVSIAVPESSRDAGCITLHFCRVMEQMGEQVELGPVPLTRLRSNLSFHLTEKCRTGQISVWFLFLLFFDKNLKCLLMYVSVLELLGVSAVEPHPVSREDESGSASSNTICLSAPHVTFRAHIHLYNTIESLFGIS